MIVSTNINVAVYASVVRCASDYRHQHGAASLARRLQCDLSRIRRHKFAQQRCACSTDRDSMEMTTTWPAAAAAAAAAAAGGGAGGVLV